MKEFDKEEISYFLPNYFKGLSKKYILDVIFNEDIQKNWSPRVGDVIVSCTGNIFTISGEHQLVSELGGKIFFFGGGLCNREGSNVLNETYCYTMNFSGKWYTYENGTIVEKPNCYHSSWKNFRYVPYPHELK